MLETPINVHPSNGEVRDLTNTNGSFNLQLKADKASYMFGEIYGLNDDDLRMCWNVFDEPYAPRGYNNDVVTMRPMSGVSGYGLNYGEDYKYRYCICQGAPKYRTDGLGDSKLSLGQHKDTTDVCLFYTDDISNISVHEYNANYFYIELPTMPGLYFDNLYRTFPRSTSSDYIYQYKHSQLKNNHYYYNHTSVCFFKDSTTYYINAIWYDATHKRLYFENKSDHNTSTIKSILSNQASGWKFQIPLNAYLKKPEILFGRANIEAIPSQGKRVDGDTTDTKDYNSRKILWISHSISFNKPFMNSRYTSSGSDTKEKQLNNKRTANQDSLMSGTMFAKISYLGSVFSEGSSSSTSEHIVDVRRIVAYYEVYDTQTNNTQYFLELDYPLSCPLFATSKNPTVEIYTNYILTPWYDFKCRQKPTGSISAERYYDGLRVSSNYSQEQDVSLKSYKMEILDEKGKAVIAETDNTYSYKLNSTFKIPLSTASYTVKSTLTTQENDTISRTTKYIPVDSDSPGCYIVDSKNDISTLPTTKKAGTAAWNENIDCEPYGSIALVIEDGDVYILDDEGWKSQFEATKSRLKEVST